MVVQKKEQPLHLYLKPIRKKDLDNQFQLMTNEIEECTKILDASEIKTTKSNGGKEHVFQFTMKHVQMTDVNVRLCRDEKTHQYKWLTLSAKYGGETFKGECDLRDQTWIDVKDQVTEIHNFLVYTTRNCVGDRDTMKEKIENVSRMKTEDVAVHRLLQALHLRLKLVEELYDSDGDSFSDFEEM